jgi:hypothetical protein
MPRRAKKTEKARTFPIAMTASPQKEKFLTLNISYLFNIISPNAVEITEFASNW